MIIHSIRTDIYRNNENLCHFILRHLKDHPLRNGDILAITSKVVSLAEGRTLAKQAVKDKEDLVRQESDYFLGKGQYDCFLTIKHNMFIPSAGIDESNSEHQEYILYPQNPYRSAQLLWRLLREHFNVEELGLILTDSHTTPLRKGVTGIALAHAGFHGVTSRVGQQDIFGKPLKFTYINDADALAVMAVYSMGEANEQRPLAIIREATTVNFTTEIVGPCTIEPTRDLYYPLFQEIYQTSQRF